MTPFRYMLEAVSAVSGVPSDEIRTTSPTSTRRQGPVAARWALFLLLTKQGKSQMEIAALMGCDHTSVGYALKRIDQNPLATRFAAAAENRMKSEWFVLPDQTSPLSTLPPMPVA